MRLSAFVLAASLPSVPAAQAATFNLTTTIGTPQNSVGPGLVVKADDLNPANGPFTSDFGSFDLDNIGDIFSFDASVPYTDEPSVEAEDTALSPFSVLFDVASYGMAEWLGTTNGRILGGERFGFPYPFNGPLGFALLGIDGGKALNFAGLTGPFKLGVLELAPGRKNGVVASYTIQLVPAPVPLPAALPLALGALGLLGVASRRRKARVA